MQAFVYDRFGPPEVLQLRNIAKPAPKDGEVLVRVRATTVTAGDWRMRSLELPAGFAVIGRLLFGITKPRQPILGSELAGDVEAIGNAVSKFKVGDAVYAFADTRMGCYAEYKSMPENGAIALKPANLSYEEAAALCFGGTTALDFFRRAHLRSGERVLVNGASGGVGTAAVQLAKHFGAVVTGVCSTANLELVRSLGADRVIDYTREDFAGATETFDVIVDTVGTAPYARCEKSLARGGRMLLVASGLADMLKAPWQSMVSDKRIVAGPAKVRNEDVRLLGELAAAGKFRPPIDRRYLFEELVAAHQYVDQGHKKGNVVITLPV